MYEMSTKRRGLDDNRGSAMIEMSILIPTVIFLVFAIFYSMIYQIDCSIAKSVLGETVIGSADVVKTNGRIENGRFEVLELQNRELFYMMKNSYEGLEEQAMKKIKDALNQRLILAKVDIISVKIKNDEVIGKIQLQMKIPMEGIRQLIGRVLKSEYEFQIENVNGAESIRRWDEIDSIK